MQDISNFISSVGFPIVVCLLMIYQNEKTSEQFINIVQELKELVEDNTKAINLILKTDKQQDNLIETVDNKVSDKNETK